MDGLILLEQGPGATENMGAKVWFRTLLMMSVDINFGCGVLGHASWCLLGWMELSFGGGTWGNRKHVRQSVVQNASYAVDFNIGSGVLDKQTSKNLRCGNRKGLEHLGMLLTRWCLLAWIELVIWSKHLGQPKTCAPKCGAKRRS